MPTWSPAWKVRQLPCCSLEGRDEIPDVKVGLELADLLAVGVHLLLSVVSILVDLLDDDFGVAVGE